MNDYFRLAHPAFHSLRNRLRYLIEQYSDLSRWRHEGTGEWLCGLSAWQREKKSKTKVFTDIDALRATAEGSAKMHPADQLATIFKRAAGPMRFNDLALLMAQSWNVHEAQEVQVEETELPDGRRPADKGMEQKQWMRGLWEEIIKLNSKQRVALLLNLKGEDGSSSTSLLVMTGVVTLEEMAKAESAGDRFCGDMAEASAE